MGRARERSALVHLAGGHATGRRRHFMKGNKAGSAHAEAQVTGWSSRRGAV